MSSRLVTASLAFLMTVLGAGEAGAFTITLSGNHLVRIDAREGIYRIDSDDRPKTRELRTTSTAGAWNDASSTGDLGGDLSGGLAESGFELTFSWNDGDREQDVTNARAAIFLAADRDGIHDHPVGYGDEDLAEVSPLEVGAIAPLRRAAR